MLRALITETLKHMLREACRDGTVKLAKAAGEKLAEQRRDSAPRMTPPVSITGATGTGSIEPQPGGRCPRSHPIKAGRNRSGELIYHTKASASYGATEAQVCFATDADALAAGYFPAFLELGSDHVK
jgi:hypothetical protein